MILINKSLRFLNQKKSFLGIIFFAVLIYTFMVNWIYKIIVSSVNTELDFFNYASVSYLFEFLMNVATRFSQQVIAFMTMLFISSVLAISLMMAFYISYIVRDEQLYIQKYLKNLLKSIRVTSLGILITFVYSIFSAVCLVPGLALLGITRLHPEVMFVAIFVIMYTFMVLFVNIAIIQVYFFTWAKGLFFLNESEYAEVKRRRKENFYLYFIRSVKFNILVIILSIVLILLFD